MKLKFFFLDRKSIRVNRKLTFNRKSNHSCYSRFLHYLLVFPVRYTSVINPVSNHSRTVRVTGRHSLKNTQFDKFDNFTHAANRRYYLTAGRSSPIPSPILVFTNFSFQIVTGLSVALPVRCLKKKFISSKTSHEDKNINEV